MSIHSQDTVFAEKYTEVNGRNRLKGKSLGNAGAAVLGEDNTPEASLVRGELRWGYPGRESTRWAGEGSVGLETRPGGVWSFKDGRESW